MSEWNATSFGALDLREHELGARGFELVVTPTRSHEPVFLFGTGAELWRRLVTSPLDDTILDSSTREMLKDFRTMGIASSDPQARAQLHRLDRPWLLSPLHELVYALIANVAAENDIDVVFIKGPVLHAQGLRDREHSGDVDCWVRPGDDLRLANAMKEWGWTPLYSPFTSTGLPHSLTLRAGGWGCAIDVHCRFPGMTISPGDAFKLIRAETEQRAFAGVVVHTPSRVAHSVVAALHEVRPFRGARPTTHQIDSARRSLHAAGAACVEMTDRMGAGYVLGEPLRAAFPDQDIRLLNERAPDDWALRLTPYGTRRYLMALRLVPLRQRLRVLRNLVWPASSVMRIGLELPDASGWNLARLRLQRIWQSITSYARSR